MEQLWYIWRRLVMIRFALILAAAVMTILMGCSAQPLVSQNARGDSVPATDQVQQERVAATATLQPTSVPTMISTETAAQARLTSTPTAAPASTPTTTPSSTPTAVPTTTPTPTPTATHTPMPTPSGPMVTIGGVRFVAEIADTGELRSKGLGQRDSLAEQTGMLFLFPDGRASSFWMRGMRFPIDFVWIGADCKVVDITANVRHAPANTPSSELEIYTSAYPAAYTFEINAGEAELFGLELGDAVRFDEIESEFAKCCEAGSCID